MRDEPFVNSWRGELYRGVRRLYAGNDVVSEKVKKTACARCPLPEDQDRYDDFFVELLKEAPKSIVDWAVSILPSDLANVLATEGRPDGAAPRNYYEAKRWYNLVQALDERARGVDRPQSYPAALILDPSSACSLRCPMCPVSYTPEVRQKKILHTDLFDRILAELGPYLFLVDLFNWGEPLLNKNLGEMIAKIKRYDIEIRISSSLAVPVDDSVFESMVMNGLDVLTVSIDGYTQETYEKYRVRGDLVLALSNLERLVAIKNRFHSTKPVIDWQYLVFSFNEHEVGAARAHAERLGIQFRAAAPYININKYPDWVSTQPEYQLPLYRQILDERRKVENVTHQTLLDLRAEEHAGAFVEGFYNWRTGSGRWMSHRGVIRVPLTQNSTLITVEGYAHPVTVKKGLKLTFFAGSQRIGETPIERAGPFTLVIPVNLSNVEATAPLIVESSATFVPAQSAQASLDRRTLSVFIHKVGIGAEKRSLPLLAQTTSLAP